MDWTPSGTANKRYYRPWINERKRLIHASNIQSIFGTGHAPQLERFRSARLFACQIVTVTITAMTKQPNIIFFVGEDTGRHQGCYGDAFADTPNIDGLAADGCIFKNAFSTAPVCAPSRSTLITGQFATKFGSHHMRSTALNVPRTFTAEMRDAGYYVNWTNKTDFNFTPPDEFADDRSDWIASLEAGDVPDKPFLLYYNFAPTHESKLWPPGANPDNDPHVDDPPHPKGVDADHLQGIRVPAYLPDTYATRSAIHRYYQRLEEQDAFVGRIISALETNDLYDDTIIIYMSDHGRGLNREKRWLYEAGIHLPLIVCAPGMLDAGSHSEALVSWVDLAPTLNSLAGIELPDRYDGRVFFGPEAQPEPEHVFAARDRIGEAFDRVRASRDRRYLYIRNDFPEITRAQRVRYYETSPVTRELREKYFKGDLRFPADAWMQPTKPGEELYDTVADPDCVHNLAAREEYQDILKTHREATKNWCERINDFGFTSEKQLAKDGIVEDRIAEFAANIKPLPEHLSGNGIYESVVTEPGT